MGIPKLNRDMIKYASASDRLQWTFTAEDALEGKEHRIAEAVARGLVRKTKSGDIVPTKLYKDMIEGKI